MSTRLPNYPSKSRDTNGASWVASATGESCAISAAFSSSNNVAQQFGSEAFAGTRPCEPLTSKGLVAVDGLNRWAMRRQSNQSSHGS